MSPDPVSPDPDYSYYLGDRDTALLEQPFSNHLGWQYITSEQFDNIEDNFEASNSEYKSGSTFYKEKGVRSWGRPSFVPEGCINLAGKTVSREEAIFFAVPFHIEKRSISPLAQEH